MQGLAGARWVHAGALARSDFPAETMAELARGRRVSLDGQGLVRPARTGPLELDADFDPEVLRHVTILKLAEEEAEALLGGEPTEDALRELGVPEVLVTFGSLGSLVLANGQLERVDARRDRGRPDRRGRRVLGRLPRLARVRARAGRRRPPGQRARRRDAERAAPVRALVRTADGVYEVELEDEVVLGPGGRRGRAGRRSRSRCRGSSPPRRRARP